ncbi:MAG: hypothetical protein IPG67_12600 [Acidobacteria bacterium]|nr:hypothetical protein [Acidobacteriota bacterium]
MKRIANSLALMAVVTIALLAAAGLASAQADRTPKKRLTSPATVKGYVGGEAHDSYVIRVQKGKTLTVNISWRRRDNNRAEFSVSRSANFYSSSAVTFGAESNRGKRWRGKIPRTGNYYIYVVAHPTVNYTLKVSLK